MNKVPVQPRMKRQIKEKLLILPILLYCMWGLA
jgi:hypothetical protein